MHAFQQANVPLNQILKQTYNFLQKRFDVALLTNEELMLYSRVILLMNWQFHPAVVAGIVRQHIDRQKELPFDLEVTTAIAKMAG
jgi:hypothetical protein